MNIRNGKIHKSNYAYNLDPAGRKYLDLDKDENFKLAAAIFLACYEKTTQRSEFTPSKHTLEVVGGYSSRSNLVHVIDFFGYREWHTKTNFLGECLGNCISNVSVWKNDSDEISVVRWLLRGGEEDKRVIAFIYMMVELHKRGSYHPLIEAIGARLEERGVFLPRRTCSSCDKSFLALSDGHQCFGCIDDCSAQNKQIII